MPANLKDPFSESCCDGGAQSNAKSAQSCGCDPGAGWVCLVHKEERRKKTEAVMGSQAGFMFTGSAEDNQKALQNYPSGGGGGSSTSIGPTYKQVIDRPTNPVTFKGIPIFTEADAAREKQSTFIIKDSGKRDTFAGGMVRDTTEGKVNWALVADGPMLKRWAIHLTSGAKKYAARNWMKAEGQVEYDRAKESAFRHFMQWFNGERDEDHGAAVIFNINEAEYILEKTK